MNWLDFYRIERTGFGLGLAALAVVWVYPVATAMYSWRIHAVFSKVCAVISISAGLVVLAKSERKVFYFFDVDMAGPGIAVYLGCALLFALGVFRYAKAAPLAPETKI